MTTKSLITSIHSSIWTPVFLAIGSIIGVFTYDTNTGRAIGLMVGSVITILVENIKKEPSRITMTVGIIGLVVAIILLSLQGR